MNRFIKMGPNDMVATALVDLKSGEVAHIFDTDNKLVLKLEALEDIPYGNKIALSDVEQGTKLMKYNACIGECTQAIARGTLVHVHNVKSLVVDIPPAFKQEIMRQIKDVKDV